MATHKNLNRGEVSTNWLGKVEGCVIVFYELFDYKLNNMTNKEKLIRLMLDCNVLSFSNNGEYYINTENFDSNNQISKIGEVFADIIMENNIEFDTIFGAAYHGIAFAMATAVKLYDKYDASVNVAYDRKKEDSRGRSICGHTIKEKERVVIIDDLVNSGQCTLALIDKIKSMADVEVVAVVTIANENSGTSEMYKMVNEYGIRFYSIICDEDIKHYRRKNF